MRQDGRDYTANIRALRQAAGADGWTAVAARHCLRGATYWCSVADGEIDCPFEIGFEVPEGSGHAESPGK